VLLFPKRSTVAFSPDGKTLAVGTHGEVEIWDTTRNELLTRLKDISVYVRSVAFTRDGKTLFSAGGSFGRAWDTSNWKVVADHGEGIALLSACPDGKGLLCGRETIRVAIMDLKTMKIARTFPTTPLWVVSLSCSPDGRTFALGACDGTVELWDIEKGERTSILQHRTDWPAYVAYSPAGNLIAYSGGAENTIHFFDVATKQVSRTLPGGGSSVARVAFSPDGKRFSACSGGTVVIWDVTTGERIARLGH
jgi:WD40 repeat protein